MIAATYSISFGFLVDTARMTVTLEADVQEHHSDRYYVVSNFRIPGIASRTVLPPIRILQEKGHWVHTDSRQTTDLSETVGKAIEKMKDPPLGRP